MLWAHASPQPKRHLDRFSRLCTDDRGVSLYTGLPVSPSTLPVPMLVSGRHVIRGSFGPPESGTQNGNLIVSDVLAGLTSVTD